MTLKEAREQTGITSAKFAQIIGMKPHTYERIENHPETATVDQALRICKAIGTDIDAIRWG